jgi:hypothetical protein
MYLINYKKLKRLSFLILIPLSLFILSCSGVKSTETNRFTFSRQFLQGSELAPRGGTTLGPDVTLAKNQSNEWIKLRESRISKHEKDRRAILAMAGDYRASFEFIETVPFLNEYKIDRPYQSWATERIYVIAEEENLISLQHILVMFFIEDGKIEGPLVVKHWRQDWTYEPEKYFEYAGNNKWVLKNITKQQAMGKWLQEVFHVDDSPRYASVGSWVHTDKFSEWQGNATYRPLPRREFSVRSDYNVLDAENRHIVLPTGWVHEQENLKLKIDVDENKDYLAKEIGLNRYDRISDFDFSGGDKYWENTEDYWKAVRTVWAGIYDKNSEFVFIPKLEDRSLISKQFEFADNYQGDLSQLQLIKHAKMLISPHIEK